MPGKWMGCSAFADLWLITRFARGQVYIRSIVLPIWPNPALKRDCAKARSPLAPEQGPALREGEPGVRNQWASGPWLNCRVMLAGRRRYV